MPDAYCATSIGSGSGQGDGRTSDGRRTKPQQPNRLAPGTEQVLQMGIEEARRMGHHYIGTEHLLLGMVRQGEGVGMDVLRRLGITPEQIRRQTRRALQETPTPPHGSVFRKRTQRAASQDPHDRSARD